MVFNILMILNILKKLIQWKYLLGNINIIGVYVPKWKFSAMVFI